MKDSYRATWARIWAIWVIVVAASFAVLEGLALINRKPGDTLSEHTRTWIGTKNGWKSPGVLAFIGALVGFVVWFIPHIVWEVW